MTVHSSAVRHSAYRPDIDGLRAIAILPVLFYHAGVRGFSGGFVGVDVFFVISGYLITGILVRDLDDRHYSLAEFYRRRVLRIFPALFAMIAVTTAVSFIFLLPPEMRQFSTALLATSLFLSNMEFYRATDYFNLGASASPLLHTWSLAVEEQWYIFWPLLLAAIGRNRHRAMRYTAGAITLVSLAFSFWLISVDSAATFYFLPPRAWELGFGALLAMTRVSISRPYLNELVAVVGLGLIAFSVKYYTHLTQFPALAAVPPCLGATLLLLSGRAASSVNSALSIAPARFIGKISYSLYLWHWPVIIFFSVGLFWPQVGFTIWLEILISLLLGTFSFYFFERPIRMRSSKWPTKWVLTSAVLAICVVVSVAVASPFIASKISTLTPSQRQLSEYVYFDGDAAYRRDTCFKVGPRSHFDADKCLTAKGGAPIILIVGDSHAAQLWPGFSEHQDEFNVLQATVTNCVAQLYPATTTGYCQRFFNDIFRNWLPAHPVSALLIASKWDAANIDGIEGTLRDPIIRAAHPILVGPVPQYTSELPRLLIFSERFHDPGLIQRSHAANFFALDKQMREIAKRTSTPYISLVDLLCKGQVCQTMAQDMVPMQFDYGHLTPQGSSVVVNGMLPEINALIKSEHN